MQKANSVKSVQDSVICVIRLKGQEACHRRSVDIGAPFCNLCMDGGLLPRYLCVIQNYKVKMKMIINICLLMATLSFSNCNKDQTASYPPSGGENIPVPATTEHLTTRSTIADVLAHPAFDGFSRYILPLEWGYDADMQLSNVSRLLPYHNYIDAERCVDYINQMIDSVAAGRKIYYDLGRKDAGLFFFRGRPGAPFAVICPGGGFSYVGSIHEGFPHALALSRMGYNVFVIQYRTGSAQVACEDLAAGIGYIFRHATDLQVDTAGYSVWGSSAGARMAAYIGSYGTVAFGAAQLPRPRMVVMAYTGHSEHTRQDPPTYAVVGSNDGIANPNTMRRRTEALQAIGIPAEFHLYPNLRHGFGLGIGTSAEGWIDGAVRFWEENR